MPNEYDYSSKWIVASNIKRLMRKKGVIASDVCRALDIPNATFSDWINGKTYPRIKQLDKLIEYFDVSRSDIVDIPIDRDDPLLEIARVKTSAKLSNLTDRQRRFIEILDQYPPETQDALIDRLEGIMLLLQSQDHKL